MPGYNRTAEGSPAVMAIAGVTAPATPDVGSPNKPVIGLNTRPATGPVAVDHPNHLAVFATVLTLLSGFLDAVAYVELNHLYVSFMSGNSTHLGMVLATGSLPDVLAGATIILAFVAGASAGTWVADRATRHTFTTVLGCETVLFSIALAFAFGHQAHIALALATLSMGMQNALHQVVAGADVGRGYITGALFGLGQAIARLSSDKAAPGRAASNLLSWCAFVGGAVGGTLSIAAFGLISCLAAAAVVIVLLVIGLRLRLV